MSATDLLKGCPLFYELYDKEIESIIKTCSVASYDQGDRIIKQGDVGQEIFIILMGEAQVTITKADREIELTQLRKGDVFGELVLINQTTRTANIYALTNCDILVMDHDTIFSLFKKNTKIFAVLLLNLSRLLTKRLNQANQTIEAIKQDLR